MNQKQTVGIDRRIRLEWLEYTVELYKQKLSEKEINEALSNEVSGHLSVGKSSVSRGSGEKAITNLMKIWIRVPDELLSLRERGIQLFIESPKNHHIALHWGMIIAVYPFWGLVANYTGRLLRLQKNVTPVQIQQRLKEQYGERPTVKDATRRALRSMVDWKVLKESKEKGIYVNGLVINLDNPKLVSWLIEATFHFLPRQAISLKELINNPVLYPFKLMEISLKYLLENNSDYEIQTYGLNEPMLLLKK
jgi:hypothetical protein